MEDWVSGCKPRLQNSCKWPKFSTAGCECIASFPPALRSSLSVVRCRQRDSRGSGKLSSQLATNNEGRQSTGYCFEPTNATGYFD